MRPVQIGGIPGYDSFKAGRPGGKATGKARPEWLVPFRVENALYTPPDYASISLRVNLFGNGAAAPPPMNAGLLNRADVPISRTDAGIWLTECRIEISGLRGLNFSGGYQFYIRRSNAGFGSPSNSTIGIFPILATSPPGAVLVANLRRASATAYYLPYNSGGLNGLLQSIFADSPAPILRSGSSPPNVYPTGRVILSGFYETDDKP